MCSAVPVLLPGRPLHFRPVDLDVFDPSFVSAVAALGPLGFTLIAIGAFVFRWVHTRGEYAEMRADRDEWRKFADLTLAKVDRLADAFEAYVRTKP